MWKNKKELKKKKRESWDLLNKKQNNSMKKIDLNEKKV